MSAANVHVVRSGERVSVASPYNPAFPSQAKRIGGRWDSIRKVWTFDARDEERVRQICREVYGTDGSAPATMVTVRYTVTRSDGNPLWFAGRMIAERRGRDEAVRLGDGVVVASGGFASSGGSAKYPQLASLDAVLEIRDVPASLVTEDDHITIITDGQIQRAALERRLVEIEAEAAQIREKLATL